MSDGKYDKLLMQMAGGCGSIPNLLDEFFGFLHRKTDFFVEADAELFAKRQATMGFPPGQAERILLSSFQKFPKKRLSNSPRVSAAQRASPAQQSPPSSKPSTTEKTSKPAAPKPSTRNPTSTPSATPLNDKGEQIPIGNGGVTERYHWTQSLTETTVYVSVPPGTSSRELDCKIKTNSVSLKYKDGRPPILIGDFPLAVKPGESLWSLDRDSSQIVLNLDKVQRTWWDCAVSGDTKIDTSKVDSTMKVDEYDTTTQAAIRKIMFDQKQQRLGLPTSDEILGVTLGMEGLNIPPPPSM